MPSHDDEKHAAAEAALSYIRTGMHIGVGTGTTVEHLLPLLARHARHVTYIASSPRTSEFARSLGLTLDSFDNRDRLDLTIDGADQVAPSRWLVKGAGGAHTREKILAAASDRFVVIVSADKLVDELHPPIPLELLSFGLYASLGALTPTVQRSVTPSPDGGLIADYHGQITDPESLASRLSSTPGVIEHGLFPPDLVSEVLVGHGTKVEALRRHGLRRVHGEHPRRSKEVSP
jgi:ribose 5-phosphate isomerase A